MDAGAVADTVVDFYLPYGARAAVHHLAPDHLASAESLLLKNPTRETIKRAEEHLEAIRFDDIAHKSV